MFDKKTALFSTFTALFNTYNEIFYKSFKMYAGQLVHKLEVKVFYKC